MMVEKEAFCPKYYGDYLHNKIKEMLGDKFLHQTLTNVIIPSFDIRLLQAIIFSTLKAKRNASKDAQLSDICIGTSVAPYYLPPYYFKMNASTGTKKFNLVDGGVAANNPVSFRSSKRDEKLEVGDGNSWGLFSRFMGPNNTTPLFDVVLTAMDGMVDIYMTVFFQFNDNYLRIQTDGLKHTEASTDNSKKENLENLEKIGKDLLKKPVSAVNLETGLYEPMEEQGTYEDALSKFAERLSEERRFRCKHMQLFV